MSETKSHPRPGLQPITLSRSIIPYYTPVKRPLAVIVRIRSIHSRRTPVDPSSCGGYGARCVRVVEGPEQRDVCRPDPGAGRISSGGCADLPRGRALVRSHPYPATPRTNLPSRRRSRAALMAARSRGCLTNLKRLPDMQSFADDLAAFRKDQGALDFAELFVGRSASPIASRFSANSSLPRSSRPTPHRATAIAIARPLSPRHIGP